MLAQLVEFIISGLSYRPFIHGIWPWERDLHVKIKLSLFFIGLGGISHNERTSLNRKTSIQKKRKKGEERERCPPWNRGTEEFRFCFVQC